MAMNLLLISQGCRAQRFVFGMALLMCLASTAMAQGNRVCLYERPNYGGNVFCVDSGNNANDLQRSGGVWTERIASIRVTGNVRATLFENPGFVGETYVVESDVPNVSQLRSNALRGWRRVAGSIQVERRGPSDPGQSGENRACVYSQPNFGGQSICFNIAEDVSDLRRARGWWNGRVGSVRLFGNAQLTIYESPSFGGASYLLSADVPDFNRLRSSESSPDHHTGVRRSHRSWRPSLRDFRQCG